MKEFFPGGTELQGHGEQAQGRVRIGDGDLQPPVGHQPGAVPTGVQRAGEEEESLEEPKCNHGGVTKALGEEEEGSEELTWRAGTRTQFTR
ncbi:hypothetical protein llap_21707 [Limosa lapponica baueri]|uniref:Uncharacterized protein n=1 Tax=Limosa lapponica baueri TaxID=1758121 RepID=A0A2I0T2G4_LIMLA|nr:hypothetical protein llap_21707 [Limosa lapponica baueri]